ncbi:MAG: fatty acid desaturase [Planctomycetes bacterium]|nr:fatty acid desaturase [Planctomycetota bacterium]MBI3848581.1 fatty acid desaturase [Planctomycetota bacterium]
MPRIEEPAARSGKELHDATRPFAEESVGKSWWHLVTTYALVAGALAGAALIPWWPVRLAFSVLGALSMVRAFILFHDFMHGAIFRGSRLAKALLASYGALALVPTRSWRQSHNFHHGNVGKIIGSNIGSFPIMTIEMWRAASWMQRLAYRISRSPLTILFGYFAVFVFSVTLLPLVRHPRKHWDSALSLAAHGGLIAGLWVFAGFPVLFFALLLPMTIATAVGGYLFYAQHNYEGTHVLPLDEWTYYRASLESASFMKLGPIMNFFTGNIGYHHVHHLNPHIPFYRLPETMAAIPELQNPTATSFRLRDVVENFRLSLWDPARNRMVTFRDAAFAA